jgi:hypothetical protein
MSSINVKPTLRTVREQVEARIHERTLHDVPGLLDVLDAHVSALDAIDGQPLVEAEKAKRRAAAAVEFDAARQTVIAEAIHRATAEHDQREGRLRAAVKDAGTDPSAVFRQNRAAAFAQQATEALNASDVERVFENAVLTADAEAIRATGSAGRKRLADLADAVRHVPARHAAAQAALMAFSSRVEQWSTANPPAAQALESIARARHNVAAMIQQSADFMARLYRVGAPSPAPPSLKPVPAVVPRGRLVFGETFDMLDHVRR